MSADDKDAQEDELLALASIYEEDEFCRAVDAQGGQIRLCLELPQNFRIFVGGIDPEHLLEGTMEVSFLPPVLLTFELPEDYPSTSAPEFVLRCKWLTPVQLSSLCKHLDNVWEENRGGVVLFAWIQFLKEETLEFLNITSPHDLTVYSIKKCFPKKAEVEIFDGTELANSQTPDTRVVQDSESIDSLVRDILDFNETQQRKKFQKKPYMCNICFSERLGTDCTQFKVCQHVYCNDCLKGYFEMQIKEGQVHLLSCPEPKCPSVAIPAQVKELVGDELFSRYDRLLLQASLDSMADVVYCPRLNCETPVMKEPGGAMGICTNCRFAFCALCNMTYHGVSPCKQPEDFQELEGDAANGEIGASNEDQLFEESYANYMLHASPSYQKFRRLQERASKEFIKMNFKPCPSCGIPIEKDGGCNVMNCQICMKRFCWNCCCAFATGEIIKHISDPNAPCNH